MSAPDKPTQEKPVLVYVYDALCGWCYGFAPVMQQLAAAYREQLTFEVVSGGMVTGGRIGPIGQVAPYIKTAYRDVEQATGVTFGEGFLRNILDEGTAVFSSLKPGAALTAYKTHHPDRVVAFAHRLQRAIYYDGIEPDNYDAYRPLATEAGLDADAFVALMQAPATLAATQAEFALSAELGVTGFPTVFVRTGEKWFVLAKGYTNFEILSARVQQAIVQLA